jgi:hypothetical protein
MLSRLLSYWNSLWRRPAFEASMDDELRFHLEKRIEDIMRGGLSRAEAERRAALEFGGMEQYKERCREARGLRLFDELRSDLVYSFRSLRRNALLSIGVILTLTLGIGMNTGVYSLINAEALSPRVDKDPDTFLHVFLGYARESDHRFRMNDATLGDYVAFRDGMRSLSELAGMYQFQAMLGRDDPQDVRGQLVTCNFFPVYGLTRAKLGRLLLPEECAQPGGAPVIVLSEELWRSRFAADPQIIGKTMAVNRHSMTVVGVTPAGSSVRVNSALFWVPYTMQPLVDLRKNLFRQEDAAWLWLAGRLKPGFSRRDAEAELSILARQQDQLHPGRETTLLVTDGSWFAYPGMRERAMWAC